MRNPGFALLLAAATGAAGIAADAATPSPKTVPGSATGCTDAITVTLARDGWQGSNGRPFAPARLTAFRVAAADAFRKAGNHACATVPAVRRALASVKIVRVASGSGATEPTFYRDAGQLVFQYAFNEANLAMPSQAAIELGLRCHADPKRRECADMGD